MIGKHVRLPFAVVIFNFMLAGVAFSQMPGPQVAWVGIENGRVTEKHATFTLPQGSGGTYALDLFVDPSAPIQFYRFEIDDITGGGNELVWGHMTSSSIPQCNNPNAQTVVLTGGRTYEMWVAYPLQDPPPTTVWIWAQIKLFYTCGGQ